MTYFEKFLIRPVWKVKRLKVPPWIVIYLSSTVYLHLRTLENKSYFADGTTCSEVACNLNFTVGYTVVIQKRRVIDNKLDSTLDSACICIQEVNYMIID